MMTMSRSSALRETLQLSSSTNVNILSVPASGDCFFDCIHELLFLSAASYNNNAKNVKTTFRREEDHDHDESTSSANVPSSQHLRDYVASKLTNEQLNSYKLYPWSEIATRLGSGRRKRPEAGRFRKFFKFDRSKGIGGRVWPR